MQQRTKRVWPHPINKDDDDEWTQAHPQKKVSLLAWPIEKDELFGDRPQDEDLLLADPHDGDRPIETK